MNTATDEEAAMAGDGGDDPMADDGGDDPMADDGGDDPMADDGGDDLVPGDGGDDPMADDGGGGSAHESVVRAYWERIWIERDLDALQDVIADRVVRHTAEGTETLSRREFRSRLAGAFDAVRATEVSFDAMTTEGSTVWVRLTVRGVSLATAAPMVLAWLAQYRIEEGRIAELWGLHQPGTDWS